MSPDRPVPALMQQQIASQLAMAMGGPLDTFDPTEQAEFERQASVALDTLRCLEPEQRAELLEDLAQEPTWPELATPARSAVHQAVSAAYIANSDRLPSLTNEQLGILADAAAPLMGGVVAGPVLYRTTTAGGSYRDPESWLEIRAFVPVAGETPVVVMAGAGASLKESARDDGSLEVDPSACGRPRLSALGRDELVRDAAFELRQVAATLEAERARVDGIDVRDARFIAQELTFQADKVRRHAATLDQVVADGTADRKAKADAKAQQASAGGQHYREITQGRPTAADRPLAVAVFRERRTPDAGPPYVTLRVYDGQENLHVDGRYGVYRSTAQPAGVDPVQGTDRG